MRITRILSIFTILAFLFSATACRLSYVLHAASGQARLLNNAIPVEEALKADSLAYEERERLRLVAQVKAFGENELGLKKTKNYQTVYLKSRQPPIYVVAASPKDRLTRETWWFPILGRMPSLGFFDKKSARAEKERLLEKDLDVIMGVADAYSTLGWFQDPVTLNLLEGSTVDLVETILHEMTHTTLYLKDEAEFNEGLAVLVGKVGTIQFLERTFGPSDPLTMEAKKNLEDERIFSSFLTSLLQQLERLYDSPISYQQKLTQREKVFERSLVTFGGIKGQLQTDRFTHFGGAKMNNAYLLSIGLYHRHFHLFESVLNEKGNSIKETISFLRQFTREEGDIFKRLRGYRIVSYSFSGNKPHIKP
ncbi:MAG: aminopeptidase [Desulfobacteraceae bacterium]|jgi:predicted aminopeptidase